MFKYETIDKNGTARPISKRKLVNEFHLNKADLEALHKGFTLILEEIGWRVFATPYKTQR